MQTCSEVKQLNRDIIINAILCIIMIMLLIAYSIYVIIDERKKTKYYRHTLLYETDWDKYCTMVNRQKKILFYKKVQLVWFTILVKIKRLIIWK